MAHFAVKLNGLDLPYIQTFGGPRVLFFGEMTRKERDFLASSSIPNYVGLHEMTPITDEETEAQQIQPYHCPKVLMQVFLLLHSLTYIPHDTAFQSHRQEVRQCAIHSDRGHAR